MSDRYTRVWRAPDVPRMEFAEIEVGAGTMRAAGLQVGADPLAYRMDYELETGPRFITRRLELRARGNGWSRTLTLERKGAGDWTAQGGGDGGDLPAAGGSTEKFAEALDCDIAHCPVTNTMPVLREGLMEAREPEDFVMAWVSVPDLAVHRSEQRYEPVSRDPEGAVVRYVGRHRSFVGELRLDTHGLVVHYPELADLVGS
jgi:uncharacterized protein